MICFRTLNKLFIVLLSNVTVWTLPARIPIYHSKRKDMVLFFLLNRVVPFNTITNNCISLQIIEHKKATKYAERTPGLGLGGT